MSRASVSSRMPWSNETSPDGTARPRAGRWLQMNVTGVVGEGSDDAKDAGWPALRAFPAFILRRNVSRSTPDFGLISHLHLEPRIEGAARERGAAVADLHDRSGPEA